MPRGITPRQPSRTGRQEGTRKSASRKNPGALRTPRTGDGARPHTFCSSVNLWFSERPFVMSRNHGHN